MPRRRRRSNREPQFKHVERIEGNLLSDDPDTLLRTHRKLQKATLSILRNAKSGDVLLDISNCQVMEPGGLLLTMYAFFQIWHQEKFSLWYRSVGAVREYLIENLVHFWESRADRDTTHSDEFLLREIRSRPEMVHDLSKYAEGLKETPNVSDREVAIWETQVGELTTNGFQHGGALNPEGGDAGGIINMVAGKAYGDRKRVEMGVLDFGSGIPRVIEQVAPESIRQRGDGRLIAHALKRGVTSKSVIENQGAGLYGIVNAVKENGGRLLLLSANGLVCVRNNRISSRRLNKETNGEATLNGTLAIIILHLQGGAS